MATRLKNYYAVLELEPFTEAEDIRQAFRRLARKVHPDLNGGTQEAQEKFKAINEAYEILGHPEKKLHYDLTLRQILQLQPANANVAQKETRPKVNESGDKTTHDARNRASAEAATDKPDNAGNMPLSSILDGFLKGRASKTETLPKEEAMSSTNRPVESGKANASEVPKKPEPKTTASSEAKANADNKPEPKPDTTPKQSSGPEAHAKQQASQRSTDAPRPAGFSGGQTSTQPPPPSAKATQVKAPFPTPQDLVSNTPLRGEDVTVETTISPAEAEHGVVKTVNVQHNERCKSCTGTGRLNGLLCPTCHGDKMTSRIKKLDVRIPAGVKTGSRVRVAGEGGRGTLPPEPAGKSKPSASRSKAENGDLYLLIRVVGSVHKPPPKNTRAKTVKPEDLLELEGLTHVDGLNVHVELSIPIVDAVLGCDRLVPTLHGEVRMTIPPLTSSGKVLRLKQQGLSSGGQVGDQLVTLQLYSPQSLAEAEKRLYEALRSLGH